MTDDNWKHRSDGMRCKTCIWFVDKKNINPSISMKVNGVQMPPSPPIIVGRCRRHAPTMNGFPVVYDADWCGDHKIDEEKV